LQTDYARIAKHNTELLFIHPENLERALDFVAKSKVSQESLAFPVLADPDRTIPTAYVIKKSSEEGEQVSPSAFIIDKEGILRFKYVGSDPFDRPSIDHIEEMLNLIED